MEELLTPEDYFKNKNNEIYNFIMLVFMFVYCPYNGGIGTVLLWNSVANKGVNNEPSNK